MNAAKKFLLNIVILENSDPSRTYILYKGL